MSRMVRESQASGLRERLWFGQLMLQQLMRRLAEQAGHGELLALRGSVIFHLYSSLVGLARNAADNYGVKEAGTALSLPAIEQALSAREIAAAEVELLHRARSDTRNIIHWLEQQVMLAHAASGLARRPQPPREDLGLAVDDPYAPLASGDLERLGQAVDGVRALLEEAAPYMEEW